MPDGFASFGASLPDAAMVHESGGRLSSSLSSSRRYQQRAAGVGGGRLVGFEDGVRVVSCWSTKWALSYGSAAAGGDGPVREIER